MMKTHLLGAGFLVAVTIAYASLPHKIALHDEKRAAPTYSGAVANIIYNHCTSCHRPGQVAPFSLTNYEEARKSAKSIAAVVKSKVMPPWKADSHGEFYNERRLSSSDIETLTAWAENGTPVGDSNAVPACPKFNDGWKIGTPDDVFRMPTTYSVSGEGRDVYRCFVLPNKNATDKFISNMEFRPGNRKIVHHIIAYLDMSGSARKLDEKDAEPGYSSSGGGPGFIPAAMLGGWAPGNETPTLPDGLGIMLPKGGDVVLEVHYHKSGKPETDLSEVGVKYTSKPVDQRLRLLASAQFFLNIPAGDKDHRVAATTEVTEPITVRGVTPHMHLLGREMKVWVELPDGSTKPLVYIPSWDFNWQIAYSLKEPIKLPAGSKVKLTARYDNSNDNPFNPSTPPKPVRWGEQTTDEMCLAFVAFTADNESLTKGMKVKRVSPYEVGFMP